VAYQVLESVTQPPLALTPTTTVYTGSIRIGPTGGVIVQVQGPRGGDSRWLMLQGAAYAMGGLVINYRVSVQSAPPTVDSDGE
jgi:hypothetical protein